MIDLQLLGGVAVGGATPSMDVPRRRALALLAYVAASERLAVSREKVLAILWPESDAERARNSLRQTIFELRKDLGEELFLAEPRASLQLDPAHIRVDLWRFRDALERGAPADAVAAYRGAFLDGFHVPGSAAFDLWLDQERDRTARQYFGALESLAQAAERDARHDEAVVWRQRRYDADPLSGPAALALLKAFAAAGDRAGAVRFAEQHERLIRAELEIEPEPTVTSFVAALRASRTAVTRDPAAVEPAAEPPKGVALVSRGAVLEVEAPIVPARRSHSAVIVVTAAVVLALAIGGKLVASAFSDSGPPVISLGSGATVIDGRDPSNRLVSCEGPACPAHALPIDAFVVATHSAYATPPKGSVYIAPVADGTVLESPGYRCCTTAVFENTFRMPRDVAIATISMQVVADNQAWVSINGLEFGRQDSARMNFADESRFATTFIPDSSGTNHLRITLWDGGGALGLQYTATVTYETKKRR